MQAVTKGNAGFRSLEMFLMITTLFSRMRINSSVCKATSSNIACKYMLHSVLSLCMTQHLFFLCVLIDIQAADSFATDIKAHSLDF